MNIGGPQKQITIGAEIANYASDHTRVSTINIKFVECVDNCQFFRTG